MADVKEYYNILGVAPGATPETIKQSYRKLAKQYHPDTYTGDKMYAESVMKNLNEAYSYLSDPNHRIFCESMVRESQRPSTVHPKKQEGKRGKMQEKPDKRGNVWVYFFVMLLSICVCHTFLTDYVKLWYSQNVGNLPQDIAVGLYSLIQSGGVIHFTVTNTQLLLTNGVITAIVFFFMTKRIYIKYGPLIKCLLYLITIPFGTVCIVILPYLLVVAFLGIIHTLIRKINQSFSFIRAYFGLILFSVAGLVFSFLVSLLVLIVSFGGYLFNADKLLNFLTYIIIGLFAVTGFFRFGSSKGRSY